MSRHSRDPVELFVRAAHRRWVAWRALERAGIGIIIACALALPTVGLLWWQGQSPLRAAMVIIAMGGAIGLLIGLLRRPTLLQTAIEADRQLGLHDLLATALSVPSAAFVDGHWSSAVCAMARVRTRDLHPSQLVLHRLGARTWSGIGLATALVFTLSMMTTTPTPSVAQQPSPAPDTQFRSVSPQPPPQSLAVSQPDAPRTAIAPGDRDLDAHDSITDSTRASPRNAHRADSSSHESSNGTGTGAAQSDGAVESLHSRSTSATATDREGDIASGGTGSPHSQVRSSEVSNKTTSASPTASAPPWHSSTWSTDRAAAMSAVRAGAVPAQYRDLVVEYFDREAGDAK